MGGYVYTLGKQTLRSPKWYTSWNATGAEFLDVQIRTSACHHTGLEPIGVLCQALQAHKNSVRRRIRTSIIMLKNSKDLGMSKKSA